MGPGKPIRLTQEANILHVHMPSNVAKNGLPSCATRVYIDLSTEAGKMRASMALAAYMGNKKVTFIMTDKTSCLYGSSVANDAYMYLED